MLLLLVLRQRLCARRAGDRALTLEGYACVAAAAAACVLLLLLLLLVWPALLLLIILITAARAGQQLLQRAAGGEPDLLSQHQGGHDLNRAWARAGAGSAEWNFRFDGAVSLEVPLQLEQHRQPRSPSNPPHTIADCIWERPLHSSNAGRAAGRDGAGNRGRLALLQPNLAQQAAHINHCACSHCVCNVAGDCT